MLLPIFQRCNLKLIHYEFVTNSMVESGKNIANTLKIKLTNTHLTNTFDLEKIQEICCSMTLNGED